MIYLKNINGIILILISTATIFFFGRIAGLFLFLSQDGDVVPHSFLQMKICLISLGAIGLCLLFSNQIHSLIVRINSLIMRLSTPGFLKWILVIALVLRLAVFLFMPFRLWIDYQEYDQLAMTWAEKGGYYSEGYKTAYQPPGYPFFLSRIYWIFGYHPRLGALAQVFFSVGIVLLSYLIVRKIWNEKVARWCALIMALFPSQALFVNLLASEILFTTLFLMSLLFFITAAGGRQRAIYYLAAGGACLGLATLTRAVTLTFLIIPAIYWYLTGKNIKRTAINVLIAAAAFLLVITPWMYRNHKADKGFVISTNAGINLFIGNQPGSGMGWNQPVSVEYDVGDPLKERYVDSVTRARAWEYIKDDPAGFIKRGLLKMLYFYAVDMESVGHQLVEAADAGRNDIFVFMGLLVESYYLIILFTAFLGITAVYVYKKIGRRPEGFLFWSTILYWSAVHFVFFADGRFHFPLIPIIGAFAALYISSRLKSE